MRNSALLLAIFGLTYVACSKGVTLTKGSTGSDTVEITGTVLLLSPVAGAQVVAELLGGAEPEKIGEATTDETGAFSMTIRSTNGDFVLRTTGASGGGTVEPVTSVQPIPLSQDDSLQTLLCGVALGEARSVVITPWSTLAATRALRESVVRGATVCDAWTKNIGLFSAHFASQSPWDAQPFDPTTVAAPGLASGTIHAFATMALSQHAVDLGTRAGVTDVSVVNTLSLLKLLRRDLQDLVFDGKEGEQPLNVAGNVFIDSETTRLSLAKALEAFLASDKNKSGLTSRDLSKLISAIRQDVSELYPPADAPPKDRDPTVESGAPPVITLVAPTENAWLTSEDLIVGNVFDLDGVSTLSVSIDGDERAVSPITTDPTKWLIEYKPLLPDGAHVLIVSATDAKGNASQKTVHFSVDSTGPTVLFQSCNALDDRTRTVTTALTGASYDTDATAENCTEESVTDGSQVFHSFSDLLDAGGAFASSLSLQISDAGNIESVLCRPLLNGIEMQPAVPCPTGNATATHVIPVAQAVFGATIADVTPSDTLTLEVTARDSLGNVTSRSFGFHVSVFPTPLHFVQKSLSSNYGITRFGFSASTIQQLFDTSYPLPNGVHVGEHSITNISARPIVLQTNTGLSGPSPSYSVREFTAAIKDTNTPNWRVRSCADGQMQYALCYTSCQFYCYNLGMQPARTASSNFVITVRDSTNSIVAPISGAVTLAAGETYTLIMSTTRPSIALPNDLFPSYAQYQQVFSESYNYTPNGLTTIVGNFISRNLFRVDVAGTQHQSYGALYRSVGSTSEFPTIVIGSQHYDATWAWFEHDVSYSSSKVWVPEIRSPSNTATIPARTDRGELTYTKSYSTTQAQPSYPQNGLAPGMTISGW